MSKDNMAAVTQLLRDLIAIPSVNPAFLPAGDARGGEQRVADYLAHKADRAGLEIEFQTVFPGRRNLLARLTPVGRKIRQRILLAPHMDTVGVASEAQFKPTVKRGRLYGRGACDTKGSVAAMFNALLELTASGPRPKQTEIIFTALVDEECGQSGSRKLAASGLKADLAVVGEPTLCQVVTAHKGDLWLQLETRGRAAHGATPHLGRNAIHEMAKAVHLLETKYAAALRKRKHPLLGHATINVGQIAGGKQPNIVPDRCSIQIDRRSLPGERDDAVRREIVSFLRQRGVAVTMADLKGSDPAPSMQTDAKLPLVQSLFRAASQRKAVGVDYFTDAGVLRAAGIPCVVFGPGSIAQAHTVDEWVAVSQLDKASQILLRFLRALP
jgi:acetylornithine deacetylase/succinyl-diaminopimelate desuccinylase family protein